MLDLGLCISPGFIPSREENHALNPPFFRSILYTLADAYTLKETGRPLLITLNNQCAEVGPGWLGWDYTIKKLAAILGPQLMMLECGNELDLFWNRNTNDVPPEFAADLANRAGAILGPLGIPVSATSVASEKWETYLRTMAPLCSPQVTHFNVHPYGQQPDNWGPPDWMFGKLRNIILLVQEIGGRPVTVVLSEYGVKIGDAGGEQAVALFLQAAYNTLMAFNVQYASWFAWTDGVGAPSERGQAAFGLRSENGNARPAWYTYQTLNHNTPPPPPIVELPPMPNLDRWRADVGKGLLDMMEQDSTEPAMSSEWRPFNRPANQAATIEQCIGMNNVTYCWNLLNGTGWRINPS